MTKLLGSVKNTFRVFNLDGEETDELEVDFIFVGLWEEKLGFDGILTPRLNSTNVTPKSILSRRLDVIAVEKDLTPVRSVKFMEKEAQENDNSYLRHKRAAAQTTGVPVCFKDVSSAKTTSECSIEDNFNWKNFHNFSNDRLLAVLDELIARHRENLLQNFLPKKSPKKTRKKNPVSVEDYIKVRTNIMKFYTRLMQSVRKKQNIMKLMIVKFCVSETSYRKQKR